MKNVTLAVCFCVLSISIGIAQQRGMKQLQLKDERGETFVAYENSYAIIVGIDKYQDAKAPSLNYAQKDARSIGELLASLDFPPENTRLLINQDATLMNFKRVFTSVGGKTKSNDRLIVYWAGHGETESLPRGGEIGYLVPHDGMLDALYSTCLSMDEIRKLCDRVAAKHVLFLVDACYGGLSAVTQRGIPKNTEGYLRKITVADAQQIITAGGKDEQVVESPSWGHSAFTKAILDGFQTQLVDQDNNSVVTADELYAYLQSRVFELSRSVGTVGHKPVFASLKPSEGQFAFVLEPKECMLTLKDLPQGNIVFLDGRRVSEYVQTHRQLLPAGSHTLEIDAPEIERFSTTITLSADLEYSPQLSPLEVLFVVETDPPEADVSIGGVPVGRTPLQKKLAVGEYGIEIAKEGFEAETFRTKITRQNNREKRSLKPRLLEVSVVSSPRGARVFLNDLPQGETPTTFQARPGSRQLIELQWGGEKLVTEFQVSGVGAVIADFSAKQIRFNSIEGGALGQNKPADSSPGPPPTRQDLGGLIPTLGNTRSHSSLLQIGAGLDISHFGLHQTKNWFSSSRYQVMTISTTFDSPEKIFRLDLNNSSYFVASGCFLATQNWLPVNPKPEVATALLQGRSRLWGKNLMSFGMGGGFGFTYSGVSASIQYLHFVYKDTDLAPYNGIILSADIRLLGGIFIGGQLVVLNGAGLVDPNITLVSDPKQYGVDRTSFGDPTIPCLKLGFEF